MGVFDNAVSSEGITKAIAKVALAEGSSQQGKARLLLRVPNAKWFSFDSLASFFFSPLYKLCRVIPGAGCLKLCNSHVLGAAVFVLVRRAVEAIHLVVDLAIKVNAEHRLSLGDLLRKG